MKLVGIHLLLLHLSFHGNAERFSCGTICECFTGHHGQFEGFIADCSHRNLRRVPSNLPLNTQYIDLSGNLISAVSLQDFVRLQKLAVLDLDENPLNCDDKVIKTLNSLVTVKSTCHRTDLLKRTQKASSGVHLYYGSEQEMILLRNRRALTECQKESANCVQYTCRGREYWLPYQTYWGCCQGEIHDLRESYCTKNLGLFYCNSTETMTCSNKHCVPKPWRCNKVNDCQDGSDEVGCGSCHGKFRCWNDKCIPSSAVCDAYNDCGDGSDETFCRTLDGGWCMVDQFRCATDACIARTSVCDRRVDCSDNTDETGCIQTCDADWKHYKSSCYKYIKDNSRWTDAKVLCEKLGSHLAKVDSQDAQSFVYQLGAHQPFDIWIGLSRQASSRNFTWTDGSSIGGFTNWLPGQPGSGSGGCVKMASNAGWSWKTDACTEHSAYLCEKDRVCHSPTGTTDCNSNFETPKLAFFPTEEFMSVRYGSQVRLHCTASGFPRPRVHMRINALDSHEEDGALSVLAPYKANLTFIVKMTSEVECHASNRFGSDLWRMRILLDDDESSYLKATVKLEDWVFTPELDDSLSIPFKQLASALEKQLSLVYESVGGYRDAKVVAFREGSVIADILLHAVKGTESSVRDIFFKVVKDGSIGDFKVHPDLQISNVQACPKEFFNVSWSATFEGENSTQDCPRSALGVAKRQCLQNGVWGYPDFSQCINKEYSQLRAKITGVFNSSGASNKEVTTILSKLATLTEPVKYESVLAGNIKVSTQILTEVVNYNNRFTNSRETEPVNIEAFLQSVSNLLDINNLREFVQLQKKDKTTSDLTRTMEAYGLQTAAGRSKETDLTKTVVKSNIVMGTTLVTGDVRGPLKFPNFSNASLSTSFPWKETGEQHIILPSALFRGENKPPGEGKRVASFLFKTLASILTQASAYDKVGQQFQIQSPIIASSVDPPAGKLAEPVVIAFGGIQGNEKSVVCVFWDYDLNSRDGGWSRDGCWLASRDNGTVTCECDHLTNFAVLMDTSGISSEHDEHSKALDYITVIGCSLSLLGLIMTLTVHFVLWRNLKSVKTVIHVNLSVALLMANIFLLAGYGSTEYKALCTVISVFLHFFFLGAISWMLAEGLQIYSSIVKVFGSERKIKFFYILGWGFPLLTVITCLAITQTAGYGGKNSCWLSVESGLIWTFIGPALTVVLINCIIFGLVLRAMMTSHKMMDMDERQKIKMGIKCSVVLLPLLGITWVFGVLAFDRHTVVFLYLFAVFNSFQGLFIFIFHCVLDQQVRNAVILWLRKRQRASEASGGTAGDTTLKSKRLSNSVATSQAVKMTEFSAHRYKETKPGRPTPGCSSASGNKSENTLKSRV